MHTPKVWQVTPKILTYKLGRDDKSKQAIRVLLGSGASSGEQPVQIDVDLRTDRNIQFSIYRTMQVGFGDVTIDLSTTLDEYGNLLVEQRLTNKTDKYVSFNCMLFIPDRRRQRIQVLDLKRGRATSTFVLPQGKELIGKTLWLRAEEIGGSRTLNYHVKAKP